MSSLRIGIVATEFPPDLGGMQSMALHLALHLANSHDVTVCTTRWHKPNWRFTFRVLPNLSGRTEADVAALNRVGVDIWLAMNAGYAAIAGKLNKPLVAYFHGNDFLNPWVVSTPFVQRLLSKLPFVGRRWREKRQKYARAQIGAGVTTAVKILTNSINTRDLIHKYYPNAPPIFVCHPGVEDKFFQNRNELTNDSGVVRLLTVSRLQRATRRKNIQGVLKALASLKGVLDFTYYVVGDGDDLSTLQSLSNALGLGAQVKFLGRVSEDHLLRLYRQADLFVLPVAASATDVEGFGIVYLEANAAGVPVLCSATGGATDAVVDGQTGIVLPAAAPNQIADGILRFARSRADYPSDKLKRFASNFVWKIAAARIEAHIQSSVESCVPSSEGGFARKLHLSQPSAESARMADLNNL